MKIPYEELKMLRDAIAEGTAADAHEILKTVITFFVEKGLTTAEVLSQLVQLGYTSC